MTIEPPDHRLASSIAGTPPRTWPELERYVAAEATSAGENAEAAVRELRRKGPITRLLCRQLAIAVPRQKRGKKDRPQLDDFTVVVVEALKRDYGLRGKALWDRAHSEIAGRDSFMALFENVTPAAIERRYHRVKSRSS
ncbi:hypothetical protein [Methylobacterium sp. WL9]|uniref:hypothetical protein n=1 Tax=Methylobacterium sp. WL9 TaxID=2603898 RepID=UPI0011C9C713|nr:hypothetical protein [Methylobacterium sp. WL9]TXN19421.1 hypothetical protein FV217_21445 [Methylobacterium sp. WL9]